MIRNWKQRIKRIFSSLLGKYLTPAQRIRRIVILVIVLIIYMVVQTLLFFYIKQSIILSLFFVPITIAGWLLGTWAPLLVAPVIQLFLAIMLDVMKFPSDPFGRLFIILPSLIGMGLGRMSDLTLRTKQSETALMLAKNEADLANKAKSEFLAGISHEIRTPMNSIIGFTNLLKEEIEDPRHIEKLEIILKAGNALLALIDDLLDISKIEAGKLELLNTEFTFTHLLEPVLNTFTLRAREKRLGVSLTLDETLPQRVYGDEGKIQQIIINLVSNALKFTSKGEVKIHGTYHNGNAVFKISDTGIGIAEEKQEVIFEAFRQVDPSITREYGGTGLGLAISKRLVEQMLGKIYLESKPGCGSIFTVELPLPAIASASDNTIEAKTVIMEPEVNRSGDISWMNAVLKKHNQTFRILIAEDNELNREYTKQLLKITGIAFDFAVDGKETLDMLRIALNTGSYYDLLLLDIQMPEISGLDVIQYIRSHDKFRNIYVIAVTAHAITGNSDKYLTAGFDFYIAKPINKNLLLDEIYKLILKKFKELKENNPPAGKIEKSDAVTPRIPIDLVKKFIVRLENNCELFDVSELKKMKNELETILPAQYTKEIQEKLSISIYNYDDEILREIIRKLETFVH